MLLLPHHGTLSYKTPQLKGGASVAPARRQSSRIAARTTQGCQTQTLQPSAHPGSRAKPTTKPKQAAARTKVATNQAKSSIQPRKIREDPSSGDPVTAPDAHSGKRARGRPKKAAGPIEQTPQDPGSGNQRRSAGPLVGKAIQSGARQIQTRGKSSRAPSATAASDRIPIDSSPLASSGVSHDNDLVEQHKLQNPTTALSREALEEHTRNTAPVYLVDQIRTIKRISELLLAENSVNAESSDTVVVDRQEIFNYKWGYLPPLGEEAECVLIAVLADPAIARIMARTGPESGKFRIGLQRGRNVNIEPSLDPDPQSDEINALNLEEFLPETMDQRRCHDELWCLDKIKCTGTSSEALFQRTLMISLIARHTLLYQQGTTRTQILDFSVEEPWQCLPMPMRAVWRVPDEQAFDVNFLTQPKPDLSLCFNRDSVIPEHIWTTLPPPTQALACFENVDSGASRIFHFLTIEATKGMTSINANKAKYQSLNNASQALHNMYEFFNDAGSDHKKIFFNKVRFFSVVANREGMLVRLHRAVEIPEDANPKCLIMRDQPKYRLKFEYKEFARINEDSEYSRERVFNIINRILKYATEDLGELIKAAALALATKLDDDLAAYDLRCINEGFYRHGQPGPTPTKLNSDGNLIPSSRGGRMTDVKRQLFKATLNTNQTVSRTNQTVWSGGDTERPPEAETLSQQTHGSKKRSRNDRDAGSTDGEDLQEANKRPKRAHGQNP